MREETVTLSILGCLVARGWTRFSVETPGGTGGFRLRPNAALRRGQPNRGHLIPDLILTHGDTLLICENKDRVDLDDIRKARELKSGETYSEDLDSLMGRLGTTRMAVGVGFPLSRRRPNHTTFSTFEGLDYIAEVRVDGCVVLTAITPLGTVLFST